MVLRLEVWAGGGAEGGEEGGRGEGGSGCCGLDVETGRVGSGARELSVLGVLTPRGREEQLFFRPARRATCLLGRCELREVSVHVVDEAMMG